MKNIKVLFLMTGVCVLMFFTSALAQDRQVKSLTSTKKPQVTFVELGSTSCLPCRLMQPVMRAVESRFGSQVKVIFYDVSSSKQRHYADLYSIRLIPTQVFLNNAGKEFFRHEGFFSEAEITKLLKRQGLKPLNNN
jgi:thioredoxin 1